MVSESRTRKRAPWKESIRKEQDLYELLQVPNGREATAEEIRRAYYKASLKTHPDRCPQDEKEKATQAFQAIGRAYVVLSNPELKNLYDTAGHVADDDELRWATRDAGKEDADWSAVFASLFERVSFDTLDKVKQAYQGSEEERQDLLRYYEIHKGDMNSIMCSIIFSTAEDEPRFCQIIQQAIDGAQVNDYEAFQNEPQQNVVKRKRRYKKEAKEASNYREALQQARKGDTSSLFSAIATRQKDRQEDLLQRITEKYIQKPSKKGDPMTDAEFQALDQKLWGKTPRSRL